MFSIFIVRILDCLTAIEQPFVGHSLDLKRKSNYTQIVNSTDPLSQTARELKHAELCTRGFTIVDYFGTSMFPYFLEGDQITIASYKNTKPKIGDVVVFFQGDRLILHRLIQIQRIPSESCPKYIPKGDNSQSADPSIEREKIFGKAVLIHRGSHKIKLDSTKAFATQILIAYKSFLGLKLRNYFSFCKALLKGR
ncbi:MAG: S24/S26 family peptidase [Deltaproteobacteria bacterium]